MGGCFSRSAANDGRGRVIIVSNTYAKTNKTEVAPDANGTVVQSTNNRTGKYAKKAAAAVASGVGQSGVVTSANTDVTGNVKKTEAAVADMHAGVAMKPGAPATAGEVVVVSDMDAWNAKWESHKQSGRLMVIDFSATWCAPCRRMDPIYKQLAAKFTSVDFVKIDADEFEKVTEQWKINCFPTFVLLRGGNEVTNRILGAMKDDLRAAIERNAAASAI